MYIVPKDNRASKCRWTEDEDGLWHTECGREWQFTDDGPLENRARYCIECGGAIVAKPVGRPEFVVGSRLPPSDPKETPQ